METKKLRKRKLDKKTKEVKEKESRRERAKQTESASYAEKKVTTKHSVHSNGMSLRPNGARGGTPCRSKVSKEKPKVKGKTLEKEMEKAKERACSKVKARGWGGTGAAVLSRTSVARRCMGQPGRRMEPHRSCVKIQVYQKHGRKSGAHEADGDQGEEQVRSVA